MTLTLSFRIFQYLIRHFVSWHWTHQLFSFDLDLPSTHFTVKRLFNNLSRCSFRPAILESTSSDVLIFLCLCPAFSFSFPAFFISLCSKHPWPISANCSWIPCPSRFNHFYFSFTSSLTLLRAFLNFTDLFVFSSSPPLTPTHRFYDCN